MDYYINAFALWNVESVEVLVPLGYGSINLQNAFELMILSTFIRISQIFYLTEIFITNGKSVDRNMTAFQLNILLQNLVWDLKYN